MLKFQDLLGRRLLSQQFLTQLRQTLRTLLGGGGTVAGRYVLVALFAAGYVAPQLDGDLANPFRRHFVDAPPVVPFKRDWRSLAFVRFGFTTLNVPLPRYSAS